MVLAMKSLKIDSDVDSGGNGAAISTKILNNVGNLSVVPQDQSNALYVWQPSDIV